MLIIPTTKSPRFKVTKSPRGQYRFTLRANNGRTILTSEAYSNLADCVASIESVRINCVLPERYIRKKLRGKSYFILTAGNNKTLGVSEHYPNARNLDRGIHSVMVSAPRAEIDVDIAEEKVVPRVPKQG